MQIANGIFPSEVICKTGLELLMKASDSSAICVSSDSADMLLEREFAKRF